MSRHRDRLGILVVPGNGNSIATVLKVGVPWACDNGAFTRLDVRSYMRMLGNIYGKKPLWVTCPDKVGDARETIRLWEIWSPVICDIGLTPALVLQDGQEDLILPRANAYFIGGSTSWKLSESAADLTLEAKRRGASLHMGRVNSQKRLQTAYDLDCDTVDGTGISRWGDAHLAKFCRWLMRLEEQPIYGF